LSKLSVKEEKKEVVVGTRNNQNQNGIKNRGKSMQAGKLGLFKRS
jgi:hypothetical protein